MMRFFNILVLYVLITALSSCDKKDDRMLSLKQKITQIRNSTSAKSKTVTANFQLPPSIRYQAEVFTKAQDTKQAKHKAPSAHPLLDHSLSSLQFLGIIENENQIWAYVMTPDNITYQVKEGEAIGNQKGKIVKITPEQIDVREAIPSLMTDKLSRERIVTLKRKG